MTNVHASVAMMAVIAILAASCIDHVHIRDGHTSFIVLAPYPTLGFQRVVSVKDVGPLSFGTWKAGKSMILRETSI